MPSDGFSQRIQTAAADMNASDRAEERVMQIRRRRVLRSLAIFTITIGIMVYLAVAQRDREAERGGREQAQRVATLLQQAYNREHFLPLQIPSEAAQHGVSPGLWSFNISYPDRSRSPGRVGVCCMNPPVDLFLQDDARFVIVYDGREFSPVRLSESEFREQAAGLGFSSLLRDK